MIINCKIFEDTFAIADMDLEVNIRNDKSFTYTFWNKLRKFDQFYNSAALDMLYLSMFVFASDRKVRREAAIDGWSRKLELYIPVLELQLWEENKKLLESIVNFLSGDNWTFHFRQRDFSEEENNYRLKVEKSKLVPKQFDSICMFSGGLDSFIGAIDILQTSKMKTMFVSHYGGGKGTKEYQDALKEMFIREYDVEDDDFYQFYASAKDGKEDSTRTRSFMFFAHAIVLASALGKEKIDLVIPENGLISLNIPITNSRLGTSSTRTTHPYYMKLLQTLLFNLGLKIVLRNPYQFLTKGEMLLQCSNQGILASELHNTMSCSHPDQGRMRGERKSCHCGYCLPCVIRKAAIKRAGFEDKSDYFDSLFMSGKTAKTNLNSYKLGLARFNPRYAFLSIQTSGKITEKIEDFTDLYIRGMEEIKAYLEDLNE